MKDVTELKKAIGGGVGTLISDNLARVGGPVGNGGIGGDTEENPANPTNPPGLPARIPEDSCLHDYLTFSRDYLESEDCLIVGSILPVVSAILARRVWIRFYGRKYPNLYCMLVTKPGLRKSTNIRLAAKVGRELLADNAFIGGASSEQALFETYQLNEDRLLIEEEGNTILADWANSAPGKIVAKRFLTLYDCAGWVQNYMRMKDGEDGDSLQSIPETSTSVLIGTTFGNARFNGLEVRDGMRRRFNYYVSEKLARTIYWPPDLDGNEVEDVIDTFRPLVELEGEMRLTPESMKLWRDLQDRNRADLNSADGVDAASEAHSSALAEEGSKVLKLGMIFEACRWAKDRGRDPRYVQADTLRMAAEHQRHCLDAGQRLDRAAKRGEIRNHADVVLARVQAEAKRKGEKGHIRVTKSELTNAFAKNPGRGGGMTPDQLYCEVIPDLIDRGLAAYGPKKGKMQVFVFLGEGT